MDRHQSGQAEVQASVTGKGRRHVFYNHYSIQTLKMMSVFLGHIFYYSYFIEQEIGMERVRTLGPDHKVSH